MNWTERFLFLTPGHPLIDRTYCVDSRVLPDCHSHTNRKLVTFRGTTNSLVWPSINNSLILCSKECGCLSVTQRAKGRRQETFWDALQQIKRNKLFIAQERRQVAPTVGIPCVVLVSTAATPIATLDKHRLRLHISHCKIFLCSGHLSRSQKADYFSVRRITT